MHDIRQTLLHLSLIPSVGPATVEKIVQKLSLEQLGRLYQYSARDLQFVLQVSNTLAQVVFSGLRDTKLLEVELNLISRHEINWLTVYDQEYPLLLKQTHLPPVILYYQGAPLHTGHKCIAMVGSRQADNYGQKIVKILIPELCQNNYTLVSGGALGIDTLVHQGVLESQGQTIIVLGSGLLRPYPAINKLLFRNVAESAGSVVSSFPLQTGARPENFPARNRIISGLSHACIVIQAGQPSGALITAQFALDQGREVGAVPGPIDNPLSTGCHKLISDGAAIITASADIRVLMGEQIAQKEKTNKQKPDAQANIFVAQTKPNIQTGIDEAPQPLILPYSAKGFVGSEALVLRSPTGETGSLSKDQAGQQPAVPVDPIRAAIIQNSKNPISIDDLLSKLNIDQDVLEARLWDLQLEGVICQNFIGLWQVV